MRKECWFKDKRFKMRDDLAQEIFSKDAVNTLMLGKEANYQLGSFWMLHFALNLIMIEMNPKA